MLETIEAVYENGTFKPLHPVDLPEGAHVQIHANPTALSLEEQIRQQLLDNGSSPADAERILANLDILIASIARSEGLAVATHNLSHFQRIPGLQVVDWTV